VQQVLPVETEVVKPETTTTRYSMAKYLGIRRYPEAANLYPGCWLSKALLVEALLPTQLGPGDHW